MMSYDGQDVVGLSGDGGQANGMPPTGGVPPVGNVGAGGAGQPVGVVPPQGTMPPVAGMAQMAPMAGQMAPAGAMPLGVNMPPGSVPPPPDAGDPNAGNSGRFAQETSMWVGDLDGYMDEPFLRRAVTSCGWGQDIVRIKVVTRNHGTRTHAGYAFFDCVSEEAARRIMENGNGTPIPGTTRIWRLNLGKEGPQRSGIEANVYVGDVAPGVTDYALMQLFKAKYPSVRHAKVVCDENGNSKGYAFVRFGSAQESDRAVSEMDGFELEGKKIQLNLANRPKPRKGDGRNNSSQSRGNGGGSQSGGGKRPRNPISPDDPNNTTLFIGGTGPYLQEADLWREFSVYGDLVAVRLPVARRGFAFVRYRTREAAIQAKNALSGVQVASLNNLKPIRIEWATEQIEPQINPLQYQFALQQAMYGYMHTGGPQMQLTPAQVLQNYAAYQQQYFNTNTHAPAAKRHAPNERGYDGQGGHS